MTKTSDAADARPMSLRRSRQLPHWWAAMLGVGLWLAIAVFGLFDQVVWRAGSRAAWAFVGAALVMVPTLLSHLEVRSWLGRTGGSYGLIKATERRGATFLTGWLYLLGASAASALLALAFGRYAAAAIVHFTGISTEPVLLAAAMIAVCSVLILAPYQPRWRVTVLLLSVGAAYVLVACAYLVMGRLAAGGAGPQLHVPTGRDFYQSLLLLQAGGWALELATRRSRRADVRSVAFTISAGPLVAALLAALVMWSTLSLPTMPSVADSMPGGAAALWVVGAVVCATALHITSLLMLREFHEIGQDGLIPERLLQHGPRLGTPVALIGLQALVTLVFLAAAELLPGTDPRLALALWSAAAFVVVQLLVSVAAVQLNRHPRAAGRGLRLPLTPLVPAAGAALCFLLLLALPLPHFIVLVAALAVGVGLYQRYGREQRWDAEVGHTVFRDLDRGAELRSAYPVVVSIANPASARDLSALAGRVAKAQEGHVVLVHVTPVGDQLPLAAGRRKAEDALSLLSPLVAALEAEGILVEAVSRLARSPEQGVLDSVEDADAKLLVLGWSAKERPDGHWQLGSILEAALGRAQCAVVVARGPWAHPFDDVLVPVGAGPNAALAAEIGLSCSAGCPKRVALMHVSEPDSPEAADHGASLLATLQRRLGDDAVVTTELVLDRNLTRAVRDAAGKHEAIVLGAPEPRMLDPQEVGRLPLRIADETDVPLALVRRPIRTTTLAFRRMWRMLSDTLPTLTAEESIDLSRRLLQSASVNINYFVLILFSAVIATLGLLLDSAAVIIGAMLIAPLMGPIVATAGGIATGNSRMLREGATSVVQGALLGVFVAVVTAAVMPIAGTTGEVLSRTQPNLLDLLVGIAAGAAGAYIIARREVGEALPGVAIAAALMPPLSVVGIGLAIGRFDIAGGALLLFVANLVAIIFASAVVFLLLGTRPPRFAMREQQLKRGLMVAIASLFVISLPLAFTLGESVFRGSTEDTVRSVVEDHITTWNEAGVGSRHAPVVLEYLDVDVGWRHVQVRGTIYAARPIRGAELAALENDINASVPQTVDVGLFAVSGQWLEAGEAQATAMPVATRTVTPTSTPARTRALPMRELFTPTPTARPTVTPTPERTETD